MGNQKLKGMVLIILSAFAFGLMPTFSKLALKEGLNISSLLALRFIIASIVVWSYILIKKISFKTSFSHFFYLILISVGGYAATSISYFTALTYISSYVVVILLYLHPSLIVMYEIIFLKKKKNLKKILALIVSTLGIILIVWSDNISISLIGILLSLLSAFFYTFYILGLQEKRTKAMNPIVVTGYILLFSAISFLLKSLFTNTFYLSSSTNGILYVTAFSLVSTVFAIFAFCIGVRLIGASRAAIISTLEPVFATILGVILFKENVTFYSLIGGLLIIAAIIILEGRELELKYTKAKN